MTATMEIVTQGLDHSGLKENDFSRSPVAIEYSKYNSLQSPNHIRLLRILPGTGGGEEEQLSVTLEEVELEKTTYECLSYTWDGPRYDDTSDEVSLACYM
jgi:hypothetical protein